MSGPSILEMAANVRQKKAELDEMAAQLRQAKLDGWTNFGIAADEAMQIASDGLRHAWAALDRLQWIAKDALKTVPPNGCTTCDYHKAHPGVPWAGCTCSSSLGVREVTSEERKGRRRARLLKRREELRAELEMLDEMLAPNNQVERP